jgi:hypothetical protein
MLIEESSSRTMAAWFRRMGQSSHGKALKRRGSLVQMEGHMVNLYLDKDQMQLLVTLLMVWLGVRKQ